jgi:hypothetical protein
MDYTKLIKDAFLITWKDRILWIFGIFAGGSIGYSLRIPFQYSTSGSEIGSSQTNALSGLTATEQSALDQISNFIVEHAIAIGLIMLGIIFLAIIFWIFSIISNGALIGLGKNADESKRIGFVEGFKIGVHNFWKILEIWFLMALIMVITLAIFSVVPIALIVFKQYILLFFVGLIEFILLIIVTYAIAIIALFAYRHTVIADAGIIESISNAYNLFKKHWKKIVIVTLLMIAVGIIFGMISGAAVLILVLLLGGISFLIFLISQTAGLIAGAILLGVMIAFILVLKGAYGSFQSLVWTLTYLRL